MTWPADDDPLLHDIDAFVDRLTSGKYFAGFGWDDEIRDQRSFGDESWVAEMDGLFVGARHAFFAGKLSLAREAYQRLLRAFRLDDEVGTFCGSQSAVEMVDTDVAEAESRYLRSVYETTAPSDRAAVLAEEWFDLSSWHRLPSLCTIREALPRDVPDLETFVPLWINELRSIGGERPAVRRLLAEAVEVFGGVDGLATLARDSGAGQAERYLDWVGALRRADRSADAHAAACEALAAVERHGETCACIAEHLAVLTRDDPRAAVAARRSAWRAAPTDARLLALHQAASATGEAPQEMAAEVEVFDTAADHGAVNGRLHAALFLLAGRIDDAIGLLSATADLGARRSPGRILMPYLLAAGCAGPSRPQWGSTRVARLLRSVDHPDAWDWTAETTSSSPGRTAEDAPTPLSVLLIDQLTGAPDEPALRLRCLETAVREVDRQVDAVVLGQHRYRYAEAARLVASCAEAVTLAEGADAGTSFIAQRRDRYPRHLAFRRELDAAVRQTPLVTAPPTKGRR